MAGPALAILAYDNNGNLTGDGTRTLTWDALNQLTRVISGSTTVNYAYNGEGQRISKTIGATTTQWLYDGDNAYAEYGNSWTTPTAITTYVGTDRPQIRALVTGSASYGTATYLAQDGIDSVIASSNSADATTATQRFDAWGNKLATTGTIPQFGFTGREPDETGLVYYRARYYDPTTARFASRDPIGLQGGINLYAYVNNNPVNFSDPEGLLARQVGNAVSYAGNYIGSGLTSAVQSLATVVPGGEAMNNATANFNAGNYVSATLWGVGALADAALAVGTAGEGTVAKSALTGVVNAATRAGELRSAIPLAQQGRITLGVGLAEDANGVQRVLIGTSEPRGYLRPGVTLNHGETLIQGSGHAEANIVNFAQQNGLRLLDVGATRPICPSCAALIEGAGAKAVTPLKAP